MGTHFGVPIRPLGARLVVLCAFAILAARPLSTHAEQPAATAPAGGASTADLYATRIRPLLLDRCGTCHGESRQRGGLALHTPEAIQEGGFSGPVLAAGKPAESELLRRLRLPLDDDDHMPPKGKPQLDETEIKLIEAWITAGAPFASPNEASVPAAKGATPAVAALPAASPATQPALTTGTPPSPKAASPAADAAPPPNPSAVAALIEHLVHVERIAEGSNRLLVNFAATATSTTDAEACRLLEPVLPQLEVLLLSRCQVGDQTAELIARAPRLVQLDLRGTQLTDAGLAALARLPHLKELVLVQTHLTDAAVEHLAAMPALERVHLWKSGLSPEAIARLRERRPTLHVGAGDKPASDVREAEPDVKFIRYTPPTSKPADT